MRGPDDDDEPRQPRDHEREAEFRWGNTEAYRESSLRTSRYGQKEWAAIKAEGKALLEGAADLKRSGVSPESRQAMASAELFRQHYSRWFYEMSHEMQAMLADGYESDARFGQVYESVEPGLAAWHAESVRANARRAGAKLSIDDALATARTSMGLAPAPGGPLPATAPVDNQERHAREHEARQQARTRRPRR